MSPCVMFADPAKKLLTDIIKLASNMLTRSRLTVGRKVILSFYCALRAFNMSESKLFCFVLNVVVICHRMFFSVSF